MENKVVIVTGSAKGIGRAIAERCAESKMKIVIADIDKNLADKTAKEISDKYLVESMAVGVDVSNEEEVKSMVKEVLNKFKNIDVLVNNAGVIRLGRPFEEIENSEWNLVFNINLMGVVNCCKAVLPNMKMNKRGKIINMSSLSAYTGGLAVSPTYVASKAAIMSVTRSLAKQVAHLKINVNSVAPGLIDTDMTELCGYDPEQVPLKELGTPEHVAEGVYFLVSNASNYITGTTLDINGGLYMK